MKRSSIIYLTAIVAIALLYVSSCKKNEKVIKQKGGLNSSHLADYENAPEVSGGILTFTDQEHYNLWLEFLDESAGLDTIGTDTTDVDTTMTEEIFDEIESELSFNSLRKSLRTEFNTLNATGWTTQAEVPVMHFIGDQTVLSTLNEYGEVRIGNDVLNYLDEEHIIVIKNPDFIDDVRNFKNSSYTYASDVFEIEGVTQGTDIVLQYIYGHEPDALQKGIPTGGDLSEIDGAIIKDPCDAKKISLNGFYLAYLVTPINADYYITWGDGTSTNIQTSKLYLNHTYPATGSYTIRIYGTPVAGSGYTGTYDWRIDITLAGICRRDSRNSGYVWKTTPDGTRCTRDYVSVSMIQGGLKRIYASTEAYEWNGSTWKTKKADRLKAQACMEVLNHSTCSSWYNHCDQTEHKTDKFVQCGFNVSQNFGWNVAYSNHDIKHNNNWYNHFQQLNPCP